MVPAAHIYKDDGIDYVSKSADEMITSVRIPPASGRMTSAYWKLRRRPSFDFPLLGVAVAIEWDGEVVKQAHGALGAVGSHPVDISTYLQPLIGFKPTADLIADVALGADKPSRPLDNTDLSHFWRKRMTKVYIERALRDACGLAPLEGKLNAHLKPLPA
jgi:CO/xanthine dehydrogenase FAD-binding subunit